VAKLPRCYHVTPERRALSRGNPDQCYCSNWKVTLTATHRLKPSRNPNSQEGNITANSLPLAAKLGATECVAFVPEDTASDAKKPSASRPFNAEVCCYKSSNDPEQGCQNKPLWLVLIARMKEPSDYACEKPNYDGPKNTHCVLSFALISVVPSSSPLTRPMHTKKAHFYLPQKAADRGFSREQFDSANVRGADQFCFPMDLVSIHSRGPRVRLAQ